MMRSKVMEKQQTSPSDIINATAGLSATITPIAQTCNDITLFMKLRKKRKEIDDYLSVSESGRVDEAFVQAAKDLAQICRNTKETATQKPEDIGKIFAILSQGTYKKLKGINVKPNEIPFLDEEIDALVKCVEKKPFVVAKKLKTEDLDQQYTQYQKQVMEGIKQTEEIRGLVDKLNRLVQTHPYFKTQDFQDLENKLTGHYKAILNEATLRRNTDKALEYAGLDSQIEKIETWYKSKLDVLKCVITRCICQHRLLDPDITEDEKDQFTVLEKDATTKLVEMKDMVVQLLYTGVTSNLQKVNLPVEIPFKLSFAIHSDVGSSGDMDFFIGNIPCYPVTVENGTDVHLIYSILKTVRSDSSFRLPSLFCMICEEKTTLVFERFPMLTPSNIIEIPIPISEEHAHHMIIGFAGLADALSLLGISINMKPDMIGFTKSCQVTIDPRVFSKLIRSCSDLPSATYSHPDTVFKKNHSFVYVGWLIDMLIARRIPKLNRQHSMSEGTGLMLLPTSDIERSTFDTNMIKIMSNLYFPNTKFTNRQIQSAVTVVTNTITPKHGICPLSVAPHTKKREELVPKTLKHISSISRDREAIDLGSFSRKKDHHRRLWNYINTLNAAPSDALTSDWKYELLDERDETIEDSENARGASVIKELILDFFILIFKHRVFEKVGERWIFASTNKKCETCITENSGNGNVAIPKECSFFGVQKVYVSIGRACQLAVIRNVKIPEPIALMTMQDVMGQLMLIGEEHCIDVFPLVQSFKCLPYIYGPVQKNSDEEFFFDIGNVTTPFGIPNTINFMDFFPEVGKDVVIAIPDISLYLIEFLQNKINHTSEFASFFAMGLGKLDNSDCWRILSSEPPGVARNVLSETVRFIDPKEFIKKIKFSEGFDDTGNSVSSSLNRIWFTNIMSEKGNNDIRRKFLRATTGNEGMPPTLSDESIEVKMRPKGEKINHEKLDNIGGIEVRACFKQITFPYFDTSEDLHILLLSVGTFGTDYFTML